MQQEELVKVLNVFYAVEKKIAVNVIWTFNKDDNATRTCG